MKKTDIYNLLKHEQIVAKMQEAGKFGSNANVQMKCRSINGREAIIFNTGKHVIPDSLAGELGRAVAEMFGESLTITGTNVVTHTDSNCFIQLEYRINAVDYDYSKLSEYFEDFQSPKDIMQMVNDAKSRLWTIQQQMGVDAAICLEDFSSVVGTLSVLGNLMDMVEIKEDVDDGENSNK